MKKVLSNIVTGIFMVLIVAVGFAIGVAFVLPFVQKASPVEPTTFGSTSFTTAVKPFIFDNIATSTITTFNTFGIGTSTPTSTDYFTLGSKINQVDMYLFVHATVTDQWTIGWTISHAPSLDRGTSTVDYYNEDSSSISGSTITHVAEPLVHEIVLGDNLADLKKITICGINTDSAANTKFSPCNAGTYKIEVYRVNSDVGGAIEVYAELIGKGN